MEEKKLLNGGLIVRVGDITRMRSDAIVNAANSSLMGSMGSGGVDGAIHRAGGPAILEECEELRRSRFSDGLPAGDAVVTGAGNLLCFYVIHTVGPVWHGGRTAEAEKLYLCYQRCLEAAARLNLKSVAFPAISTGVYGYPKENAARVAYNAVDEFLSDPGHLLTVYFVFFLPADEQIFLDSISDMA